MRAVGAETNTTDFPRIRRAPLHTLQMNLGYLCNLACTHCHVEAGPKRTEPMGWPTMHVALDFMRAQGIRHLDVTGGSPEMNRYFRDFMSAARAQGMHLMDRCNPTIVEEDGYAWIPRFLADNQVEVIASLPCYTADNVDAQRGKGVFDASIAALKNSTIWAMVGAIAAWNSTWFTTRWRRFCRRHKTDSNTTTAIFFTRGSVSCSIICRTQGFVASVVGQRAEIVFDFEAHSGPYVTRNRGDLCRCPTRAVESS